MIASITPNRKLRFRKNKSDVQALMRVSGTEHNL